jgi:diguanylate cyclase (GGDEF)-like protein
MKNVLIVDDSSTMLTAIKLKFVENVNAKLFFAKNYSDAKKIIELNPNNIHAAVLDLNLPDAPDGEIVTLANTHNIPSIVLTGTLNSDLKKIILEKDIIDYLYKNDITSIDYAAKSVTRILNNYDTTVLVVDDSALYRSVLSKSLKKLHLNVLEAEDGVAALKVIESSKTKISVVITDYNMPKMDGMELTIKLRERYKKDSLMIIVISVIDETKTITKFLKIGANDFISKPFTNEEISVRLNNNLELLELFEKTRALANRDFLTDTYNRRYFFANVGSYIQRAKYDNKMVAVAMLDIDDFKKINDLYGHDVGDVALKEFVKVLKKHLRSTDLMARFGGEEFCILLTNISKDNLKSRLQAILESVEENIITTDDLTFSCTASIGAYYGVVNAIDTMIKQADTALYVAKNSGKNRFIVHQPKLI